MLLFVHFFGQAFNGTLWTHAIEYAISFREAVVPRLKKDQLLAAQGQQSACRSRAA